VRLPAKANYSRKLLEVTALNLWRSTAFWQSLNIINPWYPSYIAVIQKV